MPVTVPLPRRALLAVELPADHVAFGPKGLQIAGVEPGGMADRAGVVLGDTVSAVAELPVRTLAELGLALRRAGAAATTVIEYERRGELKTVTVEVAHSPFELLPGSEVCYGELAVNGTRLRTLATTAARPRAAVLLIQGIACESIDGGDGPLVELVRGWAAAGVDTYRIDKHGVGDSEGGPCCEIDFETECAGFAAALDAALVRSRDRGVPLFVFGHSVGGIIAAGLADRELAGLITYGTPTLRWLACLVDTTRRQLELKGAPPDEIDRAEAALVEQAFVSGLNGRSGGYHRQLDAIDPAALWARVRSPTLVVRGEHDWVVRADDQARIATLVAAPTTIVDLPGVDHVLGSHPDLAASLRDYGSGQFDPAIVATTVQWIDRLC